MSLVAASGLRVGRAQASRSAQNFVQIGLIGLGNRGGEGLMRDLLPLSECRLTAVCDVSAEKRQSRVEEINSFYREARRAATYKLCASYTDFREMLRREPLDAVVIATPDHWHALMAIESLQAGKHVYLEKPLALSVDEDKAIRAAVHASKRVFQYGTQQRSLDHIRFGCELVKNGAIGDVHSVEVWAPSGLRGGPSFTSNPPESFNYDLWLGPGPERPFNPEVCLRAGHYYDYDYSLGFIAGWGAHPLDVADWALEGANPTLFEGIGNWSPQGPFNALSTWDINVRYDNGRTLHFMDGRTNMTRFSGSGGWISLSRSDIDAEPKWLLREAIGRHGIHLHVSHNHMQDFIDAVQAARPEDVASPVESAFRSDLVSQLSNIAARCRRPIQWDNKNERITNDLDGAKMLHREYRKPWKL